MTEQDFPDPNNVFFEPWNHLINDPPVVSEGPAVLSPSSIIGKEKEEGGRITEDGMIMINGIEIAKVDDFEDAVVKSIPQAVPFWHSAQSFQIPLPRSVDEILACKKNGQIFDAGQITQILWEEQKKKDPVTAYHTKRVALIAIAIGQSYGLKGKWLDDLYVASLLHDIGKCSIPQEIIQKNGKLTEAEYDVIKRHPLVGKSTTHIVGLNRRIVNAIYQHHEDFCGSGYPKRLKGRKISLLARILKVADVLDAKTDSDRPYHQAREFKKTGLDIIRGSRTKGRNRIVLYDEAIVLAAVKAHLQNPGLWEEIKTVVPPQHSLVAS